MKELSIEEKAKAYDEAIKYAQYLINERCKENTDGSFHRADLNKMFSELAESEDERVRNKLIEFFKGYSPDEEWWGNITQEDILAWLEKQSEQKPAEGIELTPIFRIGDTLKKKGKDYTFIVDRIQGGYYHCDRNHGAFFPIEEQDRWELVEQKPAAWSEVDKKMLKWVTGYLENKMLNAPMGEERTACKNAIAWFKKLKDEQKPAWSEEDKKIISKILGICEDFKRSFDISPASRKIVQKDIDKIDSWLKSLRPQSQWKPSDEQMKGIECAIKTLQHQLNVGDKRLNSLYDALKKLKG